MREIAEFEHQGTLPLVRLLSTGGTIAGKGDSSTSLTEYKGSSLLGPQLLAAADNPSPQEARILLMLALTLTRDSAEISRIFAEY